MGHVRPAALRPPSTNQIHQRVENWHNRLTEAGALDLPRWSLALIGNRIIETTQQCMAEAKQVYRDFHRKNVEEFDEFPILQRFPYPVQEIILKEYHKLEDDPPFMAVDDTKTPCSCPFYRKWQLPCVHVLNKERLFDNVLSVAYWETRYSRWEKCGFEIYESMVPDPIPNTAKRDRELGTRTEQEIQMREIVNGMMDAYEEFEKGIADEDPMVQSLLLRRWIDMVAEHTRPMTERPLQSFIDEAEQDIQ